jgi:hypothetical protein
VQGCHERNVISKKGCESISPVAEDLSVAVKVDKNTCLL